MTSRETPTRPSGTADPASPTSRGGPLRRPGLPHVLRLGRLRPAVPPTASSPARPRRHVPRRWWVAGGVVVVALTGFVLWVVLASPWLVVRTVRIEGASAATRAQVAAVAAVPVGTPLARVPLGAIAHRVRGVTSVADVTVTRSWPHTVTITVTQVTPVAVAHDGRGFALVNGGGEPYRTVPSRPDGLPLADVQVAQLPDAAAAAAVDVAAALGSVHSALLRREVDRVQATDPLDVTVVLADGTRVTWGSSVGSAAKARTLQLLLRAHPQASAYDVSAPATPSITP